MDLEEQVCGESNSHTSQRRESSHENLPMFNHGRLQPPEQEETSMFVEQNPGPPSPSLEAEHQPEHENIEIEEDDPTSDRQQAGFSQGSDEVDPRECLSNGNEDELSDEGLLRLIAKELDQDNASDVESEDDDEPDDVPDQGCGSCKIKAKRLGRQNKALQRKREIITSKNRRIGFLLQKIKALISDAEKSAWRERRKDAIIRRNGIDPGTAKRFRSVPNPNAAFRPAPGACKAWKKSLRGFYNSSYVQGEVDINAWEDVWKAQYKQSNMSVSLMLLHPDIRLKRPEEAMDGGSITSGTSDISRFDTPFEANPTQIDFYGFDKLPTAILMNILGQVLFFSGRVVHCFARLDPHEPPADFRTARRVPGRIYISTGERTSISLTRDTISPNKLLSPLIVSRKWNYFGAHIFYGKNTFAFSSFGEFGRFCKGIGVAKLQRIAHLELHWQGGSCVRFAEVDNHADPRKSKDYRSMPLTYLTEMKRLDTLVIHIDESRTRRPSEDSSLIQYAVAATAGQPNHRMKRALRHCRGWDYVHMLRNMSWIRLYDTARMNITSDRRKSAVRDISAVIDLNRTARMENETEKAAECRLDSLDRLFPYIQGKWSPGEDDHRLVMSILDRPQLCVNDLDDYTRDIEPESGSEDDDSEDDDSGDDDNEDDDSGDDSHEDDGSEEEDEDDEGGTDIVRQVRTEAFVRAQGGGSGFARKTTRPKSEGGFVSHISDTLQPPAKAKPKEVILIEDSEDEVEIIEMPRPRYQSRQSRLSSGMFVTPGAEEKLTTTSSTLSPNPIDLTKSIGLKRSASFEPIESKRRKTEVDA